MALRGSKAHLARLRNLPRETEPLIGRALFVGANRIQVEAQLLITAGAVSGKNHVVSAPYSPPNNDDGDLANGIETAQTGPLKSEVSSNAPHSRPLEWGTSKMIERPHIRPARDNKRAEVVDLVQRAVSEAVRRSRSTAKD